VTIKNQDTESCTSTFQNNSINKEEVNMKKLALITLLGLCSLVFAQNELSDDIVASTEDITYTTSVPSKQIECLARNMYFEAKNEPDEGIKAVGFVTMNRVADDSFPKTICEVVHQKTNKTCQFSWVCLPKKQLVIKDIDTYNRIYEMAKVIAMGQATNKLYDPSRGSLFFHAAYVSPSWRAKLKRKVRIGGHIFYTKDKA
jgi:spore germination cell wall hydrolase CwlJ-like protein